jgi:hypothetical protein
VNEKELYLLSPQAPPWRAEGLLTFTGLILYSPCKNVIEYRNEGMEQGIG